MDRVSSLIVGSLAKRGLARHATSSLVLHRVNCWIQQRFSGVPASPTASTVEDGVLVIRCSHAIQVQELQLQLADLRQFLASDCPFFTLRDVRLIRA